MKYSTGKSLIGYPNIDVEKDEITFINTLIEMGIKEERALTIYKSMRDIVNLYSIPFSSILLEVIQKIDMNSIRDTKDELYVINMCMSAATVVFQDITDKLKEKIEKEMYEFILEK